MSRSHLNLIIDLLAAACLVLQYVLLVGQTRIHIDRVEGLGDFMELEVALREGQSDAEGAQIAQALMQALGLAEAPRLAGAYLDM